MNTTIHVSKNGSDQATGTKENPFLTINKAASSAVSGDTVIVHEGEYREWVKPKNKGYGDTRRITYQAAENEKVIIKGSERIHSWKNVQESIWKVKISNDFFGDFNPYIEEVNGDWIVHEDRSIKHLGNVYLNGMSFYEASSFAELLAPKVRQTIIDDWTQRETRIIHPEQTKYLWFAEVEEEFTTIYANFHDNDPNEELVEINVRKSVFSPDVTGRDYITVKGFEMAHAATPWTPPTADQMGLISTNWSKGWIIEDNTIHDSKCSAISIGKEELTGHNYFTVVKDKPGYQYQIESVFNAVNTGWSKETIGSHVIRNNKIYDCGQNGIVGHLGCIFSEIYDNHIYNIGVKREFYGHEIGGIKLHAAIDVQIHNNCIHDTSLGLWLDWQTQGTRVSQNVFYKNSRDLFIEVSHGPYVVDHNIFASAVEMDNFSQGGAYINNLFCGFIKQEEVLKRPTPYHENHSTKIAGYAAIQSGDDRYYGNIFVGNNKAEGEPAGTSFFDSHTTSLTEYIEKVQENLIGDVEPFLKIKQPVYINKNLYLNGAKAFNKEEDNIELPSFNPEVKIIEEDKEVYLSINLPDELDKLTSEVQTSSTLPAPRIVKYDFENPKGGELILNIDYLGNKKSDVSKVGPIESVVVGENKIKIW